MSPKSRSNMSSKSRTQRHAHETTVSVVMAPVSTKNLLFGGDVHGIGSPDKTNKTNKKHHSPKPRLPARGRASTYMPTVDRTGSPDNNNNNNNNNNTSGDGGSRLLSRRLSMRTMRKIPSTHSLPMSHVERDTINQNPKVQRMLGVDADGRLRPSANKPGFLKRTMSASGGLTRRFSISER